jgi:hypothetical protein
MLNTPVLFLLFNRLETTKLVFEKIKQIQPKHLFISADGARENKIGEEEMCKQVRGWVMENIDWDCEVHTRFIDNNLGCGKHVSGAISWFFSEVEEGIILEDDCVPDTSFFTFCEELLIKYRNNDNIYVIGGNNFQPKRRGNASYYFSAYGHIWGWATWRRAWQHYDFTLQSYDDHIFEKRLSSYFKEKQVLEYWNRTYKLMKYTPIDTWDFQWTFCQWKNNGLSIIPNVNLVSNIGFDENATHTKTAVKGISNLQTQSILTIIHPGRFTINKKADLYSFYKNFEAKKKQPSFWEKVRDKLKYEQKKMKKCLKQNE